VLPNFLIIGASKAGTTSLQQHLKDHPDVHMPPGTELHYFTDELGWERGEAWYRSQFDGAGGARAVGEKSTTYTRFPHSRDVPARIAALLPDVRLVYLLRHPIERIRSAHQYEVAMGREHLPIDVAVRTNDVYVDPSRYSMQIEQYLGHVGRDQLLLMTSEDLRDDPLAAMRRVYEFIDVDPSWVPTTVEHHFNRTVDKRVPVGVVRAAQRLPGYDAVAQRTPRSLRVLKHRVGTRPVPGGRGAMPDDLRAELQDRLREDLVRLPGHVGAGFDCWGLT
jgi:hypothetical protein